VTFIRRLVVPVSPEALFAWHERPGAFERLSPPWDRPRVLHAEGGIRDGARVRLSVQTGPFRTTWEIEHEGYEAGRQFCDVLRRGPFASWRHVHAMRPHPLGSELEDRIDYALPGGPLGALVAGRFTERTLARVFRYRHAVTAGDLARHAAWRDRPRLRVAITGATGFVGSALAAFLSTGGHTVVRIGRGPVRPGVVDVSWDPQRGVLDPSALEGVDAVVHLAGAPIARRWSASHRAAIRDSRVAGTRLLAEVMARVARPPAAFLSGSAIGVYGSQGATFLDERSPGGTGFLAAVGAEWEGATAPAVAAGISAGEIATGLQSEVARAGEAAERMARQLEGLRAAMEAEAGRLDAAARTAGSAAGEMAAGLGRERERLEGLASGLDARTSAVTDAIARQARLVGEVSDLAETQLREAEASFTARSTGFSEAAGRLSEAARAAGETLGQQAVRLEGAGASLAEHMSGVERTLEARRTGILAAAQALRAEQEGLAAEGEAHLARLSEVGGQARLSAADMRDSALKGGEALSSLIQEAAAQFREFADAARAERDEFGQSTRHALEAVARAAAEERQRLEAQTRAAIEALSTAAEATRQAADRNAEAARAQVDQLAEAAFSAGQKANQVFESRLEEARSLIARSAQMVEEAGDATARRLDQGAAAARRTLDELAGILARIEDRVATLPEKARTQAEQVREAVSTTNDVVRSVQSRLQFVADDASGQMVVRVMDAESNQVIRQIPSEEMLAISRAIERMQGLLIQGEA